MLDVTIGGAGLSGLLSAVVLGSLGLRVAVYDSKKAMRGDMRLLSIALGSKMALEKWGVWDADLAEPVLSVRVVDGYSGSFAHFDHDLVGPDPMGYMIPASDLHRLLLRRAESMNNIKILSGLCSAANGRHYAEIISGSNSVRSRLHIAATGRSSSSERFDYKQNMATFTIEHEYHHRGVAVERFLPSGPFAILPRRGGFSSSIIWTMKDGEGVDLQGLLDRVDYLGALQITSEIVVFPIILSYSKRYSEGRILNIGDAVHAIHPLAGQGFNLTISDMASLEKTMVKCIELGLDIGSSHVLRKYGTERRVSNAGMIAATDSLNWLFSNDNMVPKYLRRLGLKFVNKSEFIKRQLAIRAMSLH